MKVYLILSYFDLLKEFDSVDIITFSGNFLNKNSNYHFYHKFSDAFNTYYYSSYKYRPKKVYMYCADLDYSFSNTIFIRLSDNDIYSRYNRFYLRHYGNIYDK